VNNGPWVFVLFSFFSMLGLEPTALHMLDKHMVSFETRSHHLAQAGLELAIPLTYSHAQICPGNGQLFKGGFWFVGVSRACFQRRIPIGWDLPWGQKPPLHWEF
jgi:hypothetical protein